MVHTFPVSWVGIMCCSVDNGAGAKLKGVCCTEIEGGTIPYSQVLQYVNWTSCAIVPVLILAVHTYPDCIFDHPKENESYTTL